MQDFFQQIVSQFAQTTWLEWLGTLTGFLCVYLAAKQNIWNWPISIISVISYAILFYDARLYGDTLLQFYFLSTAVYGWYYWFKRKEENKKPIVKANKVQLVLSILAIICLTAAIGYLLDSKTNSDVPYIDAFCTAISFIAQFLMTRKILQNWLLWVFVDICYIPLYVHKQLMLTAVLYFVFAIIAWKGYRDWQKTYKNFA
ncbi:MULTISPECIES: nicotinamide riboside transporter PnuC [unclassified Sphingobacterium]|uniref:nicotinamide riboside transporter PnuC n=1 Tax=unclassified Sphingobacterium TaxID=2609468 RepID=UPI0025E2637E|nr:MULTISPECIES: nicotinamide riboside transporter PnuC [unclassified Sphingobacterium]